MDVIKLQHLPDGSYVTDPFITKDEWLTVLHTAEKEGKGGQIDSLLRFFRMPSNKATCKAVAKEYGTDAESERSLITNFGKFTKKALGDRFRVESSDSEEDTFWPIPMLGKNLGKKGFEWAVRPELVDALREYLLDDLMRVYRARILEGGLDNKYSKELYKWQRLAACKGKSDLEVLRSMIDMNLISWRAAASLRKMLEVEPEETVRVFSIMKDPDRSFADKFKEYKTETRKLAVNGIPNTIDNDRTAALFLACLDPVHHSLFKYDIYKVFCNYMGFSVVGGNGTFQHYLELIQPIIEREKADAELTAKLHSETDPYFWSDLLNAQDVLWQMRFYMNGSSQRNWLQKIYDQAIASKNSVFDEWYPEYEESVNFFLEMFQEGKTADDVSDEDCDYFLRSEYNGISSNKRGRYYDSEYEKIHGEWPDIYDTLKRSVLAGEIIKDDYKQLFQRLVPLQSRIKYAAYHRFWATLFPDYLTTLITDSYFYSLYKSIGERDDSLPAKTGDWLEDNLTLMSFFKEKVIFEKPWHRALFGWYLYDKVFNNSIENSSDMNKYIEILEANKNLVLTGAPGTGKTFLAKQIACQIILGKADFKHLTEKERSFFEEHYKQVQFHPSYDYSDFVEGLRPVTSDKSPNGFRRENGVMKQLCEAALLNLQEAAKTAPEQREEQDIKVKALDFINTAIGDSLQFETKTGKPFTIESVEDKAFYVSSPKAGDTLIRVPLKDLYSLLNQNQPEKVTSIHEIFGRKRTQQYESYLFSILDRIRQSVDTQRTSSLISPDISTTQVRRENFVLIIDEINRGELSKIFGELFFAIEPSYRGKSGIIQTQYQNLIEEDDVFYDGFFVPENVYVIGTMNDIDRGVESMDFAIRRRFAWMEVTADERIGMLDGVIPEWSEAAKRCMTELNKALKQKEIGLSSAYDIGPAYFLKLKEYGGDFEKLWKYHIQGILAEYLRGMRGVDEKLEELKKAYDSYKG